MASRLSLVFTVSPFWERMLEVRMWSFDWKQSEVAASGAACVLLLASAVSAAPYFSVDFNANAVGDNYTSVAGVGTNTNLIGAFPDHLTSARANGDWSATVDASKRLNFTGTGAANSSEGFQVFAPQSAPASPETWFLQFDYTRLATTGGMVGVHFMNSSGQNMLGHENNQTLYGDWFGGAQHFVVDSTYTLRLEIDSGTTVGRVYVNGVLDSTNTAQNTNAFGGVDFHPVGGTPPTDMIIDNISGGVVLVPEPASLSLLGFGALGLLRRQRTRK